jgi:hypothetical protein
MQRIPRAFGARPRGSFVRIRPLVLLLCVCCLAAAQSSPRPLTAEQVVNNLVQHNLQRAAALRAYQSTRSYRIEYRGFPSSRSAEMVVDVKYRAPYTKEFTLRSESGSKLLVEKVLKRLLQSEQEAQNDENQSHIALNNENYKLQLLGTEAAPGGPLYILFAEPRVNNKFLFRGKVWIDARDFAVVRMDGAPAKNPSFWIKETKIQQLYTKVGDFWLPVSNRSASAIRLGGSASLTIDYRDYKITSAAPLDSGESASSSSH